MTEHILTIDHSVPLAEEPKSGHNRWHASIEPRVEISPGDTVVAETRESLDGQFAPDSPHEILEQADLGVVYPLTGPIAVKGAEPGDLLSVSVSRIEPSPWLGWGWAATIPGASILPEFEAPYYTAWHMSEDRSWAECERIPGIRIPSGAYMGLIGVAPSEEDRRLALESEARLAEEGVFALPQPEPESAIPSSAAVKAGGLRTFPPRHIVGGANMDIRYATPGVTWYIPVRVPGALLSVGDGHFTQGDGQTCGSGLEMQARVHLKVGLEKGEAERRGIDGAEFARDTAFAPPRRALPERAHVTIGNADTPLAAAQLAIRDQMRFLESKGYSPEQALIVVGLTADLRIAQMVNAPYMTVTSALPLDIFA